MAELFEMSKRKGSRAELKAVKLLEAQGYVCTKAGGSLGLFDVLAVGPTDVRCVQVKCGTARLRPAERRAIAALIVPPNVSKEYWSWADYARRPVVERLQRFDGRGVRCMPAAGREPCR